MSQVTNLAFFSARHGQSEALGAALADLVEPTRLEAGCLNYDLHRNDTRRRTSPGDLEVIKRILMFLILLTGTLVAQETRVTPLLSTDLTGIPGKEGLMITVDYAPGATDSIHRHNAHAFVYVLEGSIVMQVRGGKEVTLVPGQTFYESPQEVHVVGRNASKTKPAKFLVFFVKDKGAPPRIPAK
jgi:quercetin dioxygenase-like cupin family protein